MSVSRPRLMRNCAINRNSSCFLCGQEAQTELAINSITGSALVYGSNKYRISRAQLCYTTIGCSNISCKHCLECEWTTTRNMQAHGRLFNDVSHDGVNTAWFPPSDFCRTSELGRKISGQRTIIVLLAKMMWRRIVLRMQSRRSLIVHDYWTSIMASNKRQLARRQEHEAQLLSQSSSV